MKNTGTAQHEAMAPAGGQTKSMTLDEISHQVLVRDTTVAAPQDGLRDALVAIQGVNMGSFVGRYDTIQDIVAKALSATPTAQQEAMAPSAPSAEAVGHRVSTDILFYAFRYALGRMTFVPSEVVKLLLAEWPRIDDNHRNFILKEIEEARQRGGLGMDCDIAQWDKIAALSPATIVKEGL